MKKNDSLGFDIALIYALLAFGWSSTAIKFARKNEKQKVKANSG